MFNNFQYNSFQNRFKNSTEKAIFDLELVQEERIGNLLFLAGTILSFIAADQEEQSIIRQSSNVETTPHSNDSIKTVTAASWIFLAAIIIFAVTAYERLKEQEALPPKNASLSSKNNLLGQKIVSTGDFVKVIGFSLVAIGNQIKLDNPQTPEHS